MKEKIIIRPYKSLDYEQVKINLKEGDAFEWSDTPEILENKSKNEPSSIIVAEINGKVIGNVYLINDKWFAGIFRLAVREEYRGKDIGIKLMKKAEEYLKSKGHKEVMIFVNKKYGKLISWYKKQNYRHTDNDFKAMWKEL